MGYTYHIPTRRNPFGDDVLEWREEVEELIENRLKMKILIATQKPFAAPQGTPPHIHYTHNYRALAK